MELLSVKIIVLVLMGAVRIFCGMLPLAIVKIIKRRWSKTADRRLKKCISILVFFGGGVMLATCFLHMMPEVQESFNEALPEVHLPIPQVIFVMGFFLVYMMEDIVHAMIHKRKRAKRLRKNKEKEAAAKNIPALDIGRMEKGGGGPGTDISTALRYNNNDSPILASPIAIIGKNGSYLNEGLCYANNYPDHYRKQQLSTSEVTPRDTKDIFDKNVVRKCDDIPGLPKSRIISTTNIQPKRNCATGNGRVAAGVGGGSSSGLIVGVEKFSYIDPEWFRDTVIANSQVNLLGNSSPSLVGSNNDNNSGGSNSLHDLHLNKSQNVNVISDDSNSSSWSSGSTSCSRKQLSGGIVGGKDETHDDDRDDHDHFHNEHSHLPVTFIDGDEELDQTIGAEMRNLLIVIAISFHGIFEGMAIGLQDTVEDVWYMFFAVSLYECTILFCIGIELISNKTKVLRMVLYVLIVSLVSPIGIPIGIVITEISFGSGSAQALVVGCFQGSAAGSLLYVTFFEIFQEEGRKLHRKYIHILVAILGFVMMGALEFIGGHTHGGSRNSHTHSSNSHGNETLDDHNDHDNGHALTGHHHNETDEGHYHDHDHVH